MTAELGHVSHMVLDCNTISGSQVDLVEKDFANVTLVGGGGSSGLSGRFHELG